MSAKSLLRVKITRENALSILLVVNSFAWFTLTHPVFNAILNELKLSEVERLSLLTTYFVCIAFSAIFGSKLFPRERAKFLYLWMLMGTLATMFLITAYSNGVLVNALLACFLGVSIGTGFPSCLSYFADATNIENRGFIGGITIGGMGFIVLLLAVAFSALGLFWIIGVLVAWRLAGFLSFLLLTRSNEEAEVRKSPSYLELVRKRENLLYLFPWVMFSIINFAEAPILEGVFGAESFTFVQLVAWVLIGIFAIAGGILADIIGRKRVVITGFVMLGIEYAALSVFYSLPYALYLFMAFDGVTWGLFFPVFFMAIWGDLGGNHIKEKYYTLGGLPYLLASFSSILVKPYVGSISPTAAFSFASFFLFLSVVPLMYAPETLPEKTIRERELRSYIEKAKKAREKFT